ncbi:hypothetical protein [Sorangium sp. So ce1099]|uniref:hypothetical protein n=1 Tax=unclassified Sorangium TaxID=2621164 RepID=UPI003F62348F
MGSKIRLVTPRMTWRDICRSEEFAGRWVALDNVRYVQGASQPAEADVVDADDDLADLCARMREADRTACAILFVEDDAGVPARLQRLPQLWRRVAHH